MAAMINDNDIMIFPETEQLFYFAAADFKERVNKAVNEKGFFSVVLSGGNTPKAFYEILTTNPQYSNDIPWSKIRFFFGDERYVPLDNELSNYHMTVLNLFSKLNIDPDNIFPIATSFEDPEEAARNYAEIIKPQLPFDLIYLGLGSDGHTASLMPESEVVENIMLTTENRLMASLYLPSQKMHRITMTSAAINANSQIIFMVSGTEKALALKEVLYGKFDPLHFPAQLIQCKFAKNIWLIDQAAGELL